MAGLRAAGSREGESESGSSRKSGHSATIRGRGGRARAAGGSAPGKRLWRVAFATLLDADDVARRQGALESVGELRTGRGEGRLSIPRLGQWSGGLVV